MRIFRFLMLTFIQTFPQHFIRYDRKEQRWIRQPLSLTPNPIFSLCFMQIPWPVRMAAFLFFSFFFLFIFLPTFLPFSSYCCYCYLFSLLQTTLLSSLPLLFKIFLMFQQNIFFQLYRTSFKSCPQYGLIHTNHLHALYTASRVLLKFFINSGFDLWQTVSQP